MKGEGPGQGVLRERRVDQTSEESGAEREGGAGGMARAVRVSNAHHVEKKATKHHRHSRPKKVRLR